MRTRSGHALGARGVCRAILVCLVSSCLGLSGEPLRAQDPSLIADFAAATVVATVDGEELTLGDLLLRFATLPQPQRDRYSARPQGMPEFLTDTVANLVVAREAERLGAAAEPLFEKLMQIRREELLRDLYARRTVLSEIDELALSSRYQAQKEDVYRRPPVAHVMHILVTAVKESSPPNITGDDATDDTEARAKIERILRDLTAGDAPPDAVAFADVARQLSEGTSATSGGDLGWVVHGELVPALSKAAFSLDAGETSGVVESQLGFHLVHVVERRRGGLIPYQLVRELIFQELVGERTADFARAARADRDRLLDTRQIEIFPERLPW